MLTDAVPGRALLLCAFALVHFIWQGAVLAGLLALLLPLIRRSSANTRYMSAVSILAVMALCPLVTAAILSRASIGNAAPYAASQLMQAHLAPSSLLSRDTSLSPQHLGPVPTSTLGAWIGVLHRNSKQIVLVWLIGVAILAMRGLVGWLSLRRLFKQDSEAPGPDARLAELARKMRVTRLPVLRVSYSAPSALVFGALRSVIVIPTGAILGLSPEMLDTILAHELAHVRRHDYLVNLAQCLVETLLFYHPAVWWVSHRIRDEREICCDDMVVATINDRITYARALEGLEHLRSERIAIAASGGALLNRIQRILGTGTTNMNINMESHGRNRCQLAAGICAVVLGIGTLASIRSSSAQTNAGGTVSTQTGQVSAPPPIPQSKGSTDAPVLTPIEGPGIIITLTDSMLPAGAGRQAGDGLIHDTDLQKLVHALWLANARDIYISEQRVDHDTRIRAWGNNITVDSFGMGRPFVVRALGDPDTLQKAVEAENGVLNRIRSFDPAMVAVETSDHVKLPARLADHPKAAYIIQVRILHCEVAASGKVTETLVSTPRATTYLGFPASFSTSSTSGESETLTFNPGPTTNQRIKLIATYIKTDKNLAPMHATTPPGFTIERGKNTRILGVVSTDDNELRKAVERGKVVRNRGAYQAFYVEVKVE